MKKKKRLPSDMHAKFLKVLSEVRDGSRFNMTSEFIQHGKTTVMEHCINVAYTSYYIAYKLNLKVNEEELIRGALLHDYFLYDWHEKTLANSIHGFTHPTKALRQAEIDFELSDIERDMIKHHMFPLTVMPPKTREGRILCLADKLCATKETINRRG